jgi:predicted ArsR family transcriptional regulator
MKTMPIEKHLERIRINAENCRKDVTSFLAENGISNVVEIAHGTRLSETQVRYVCKKLLADGLLYEAKLPMKTGKPAAFYSLVGR